MQSAPPTRNTQHATRQITFAAALLLIAVGFGLRLYQLAAESYWYDELLQLDIAQGLPPGVGGVTTIFPRLRGHAAVPLDYLIAHFWILLGREEGWARLPAVMVGTLALPVVYQLGRRWLGRQAGLLLLALLALSPLHVRYSQEVRPYALVLLGVTLAIYAYWRLRDTGRLRYFIPLQVGVLIFSLAHFFAWTIFAPLLLFTTFDLWPEARRKQALKLIGLLAASLILPIILLLLSGWGGLFYTVKGFGEALVEPDKFTAVPEQKPDKGQGPQLSADFVKFEILTPLGGDAADMSLWGFNLLVGLGLVYLMAQKQYRLALFLLLWLILPILIIVAFLVYRGAFFAIRYIIFVLPAYLTLLALGMMALPRWLKCAEPRWLSLAALLLVSALVFNNFRGGLERLYFEKNKEDWRLVGNFINQNAGSTDKIIAMRAEPAVNWYRPSAWTAPNYFWTLDEIKETAAAAPRSWVILSIFSSTVDDQVEAWLTEQGAVHFPLDPLITVYYLGPGATPDQLLAEAQRFALPVDHALYLSLGQQNRSRPEVARQYYRLAIEHAPTPELRAEYQAALNALAGK
ncbi:MAG: glycosyltransferase family 39 protein [Anaerolineae bacterium]|nr:glycosyltransferase family 39 protein [Anaerolineae bacterium]